MSDELLKRASSYISGEPEHELELIRDLAARVRELEAEHTRLIKSARVAWDERSKALTLSTNCQNRAERAEAERDHMRGLMLGEKAAADALLRQRDEAWAERDALRESNERLRGLLREAHSAIYNEPNDGQLDRLGERIDAALAGEKP